MRTIVTLVPGTSLFSAGGLVLFLALILTLTAIVTLILTPSLILTRANNPNLA